MISRKFFGVSLPRTGTSSLAYAIRELGLVTEHYLHKRDLDILPRVDFANDFPIPLIYKQLDEQFKGSRFLFTDRNVDDWLDSYELHWERTGHLTIGNWHEYNMEMFGTLKFDRKVFRNAFLRHREDVFEYFKDRPEALLVLDMPYTAESWKEICKFIGVKPTVYGGFPHKCGSYSVTNPHCPRDERNPDPVWR
jgi:hypothetical protein